MGTISSGVGLISGLNIQDIVDQLMAIESRPLQQLQQRKAVLQSQRTAFLDLSARLLALKNAAVRLDEGDFFRAAEATSSNTNVLVATATAGALPGTYSFQVHSLVATHQLVSSGYADMDRSPVGAGVLSVEIGAGRLDPSTPLSVLNGQRGVRGGVIRITDRSGASAEVDLRTALTIQDVLEAINSQTGIRVQAAVEGGHLVLTDLTGQTTGNLVVEEVAGGRTAADLGIAGSLAGGTLVGRDVQYIADSTPLWMLNDGNGVRRDRTLDDFRITLRDGRQIDVSLSERPRFETSLAALNGGAGVRLGVIRITNRTGASAEVDLSGAQTLGEVRDAIIAAGIGVEVSLVGSHLLLSDGTGGAQSNFKVEDVSGYAARDLGIAADVATSTITGNDIYRVRTVGDVVRAINTDSQNDGSLVASISPDGDGLVLVDSSSGSGTTTVEALNGSGAAWDLGILGQSDTGRIQSRRLLAGLNTVLIQSLRGGAGVDLGTIRITDRSGASAEVDLSGVQTVQELLDAIRGAGVGVTAGLNASGTGIVVQDISGGQGSLVIEDVSGSGAADLGLAVNGGVGEVASGNLQLQYISEATRLSELNGGRGVSRGRIRITNSSGMSASIDLTSDSVVTLGDVMARINAAPVGVVASINATGDGLLLTDTAGGTGRLKVSDESGGRMARDLRIAQEAAEGQTTIDGSFELRIEIDGDDALQDVAAKINEAGVGVQAAVINDGSAANPYRLTLRSSASGTAGVMVVDPGETGLEMSTLIAPRDAVVFLGGAGSPNAIMISSSSNTLSNVVENVTLDLVGTSSEPVTVSVTEDVDSIVESIQSFVDAFNAVVERMDALTSYDAETQERGLLLGDPTVSQIRQQLYNMVTQPVTGVSGRLTRLNQVGVTIGGGAALRFDEDRFRQVYSEDPEAVQELFALTEGGLGDRFDTRLDQLTNSINGVLARKDNTLQRQQELYDDRITSMQTLLDGKEQRLLAQFQAMESALAALQSQQSALSSLSLLIQS